MVINCKIHQKSLVYFSHSATFHLFLLKGGRGSWHNAPQKIRFRIQINELLDEVVFLFLPAPVIKNGKDVVTNNPLKSGRVPESVFANGRT